MTAKVQRAEVGRSRAPGAIDVIAQPCDPMALPDTILAIWQRVKGPPVDAPILGTT
jgi:hypothetical protein